MSMIFPSEQQRIRRYPRLVLFDLLADRAINKAEFARRLGITPGRLGMIERGDRPFPADKRSAAAELLDKPESVLFRESPRNAEPAKKLA